jgi:hypothetical protein
MQKLKKEDVVSMYEELFLDPKKRKVFKMHIVSSNLKEEYLKDKASKSDIDYYYYDLESFKRNQSYYPDFCYSLW